MPRLIYFRLPFEAPQSRLAVEQFVARWFTPTGRLSHQSGQYGSMEVDLAYRINDIMAMEQAERQGARALQRARELTREMMGRHILVGRQAGQGTWDRQGVIRRLERHWESHDWPGSYRDFGLHFRNRWGRGESMGISSPQHVPRSTRDQVPANLLGLTRLWVSYNETLYTIPTGIHSIDEQDNQGV